MPLQKLVFKPGVNRENTRYTNESGWYECDKIRFRQGTPETIGGWERISNKVYQGVCRALWSWVTLGGSSLVAVGTNLKYYVERGGSYYDITPLRYTSDAGDVTFSATTGSSIITVTDPANGADLGDFVTFFDAVGLGGNITATVLNAEYQIQSIINANTYTIDVGVTATSLDVGDGGTDAYGEYQIHVTPEYQIPTVGWGAGVWGGGPWGVGSTSNTELNIWSQANYGEDLIFGPRYGAMYYWTSSNGTTNNRAQLLVGDEVPSAQHRILISDMSRFVFAFGCNDLYTATVNPMLIRWSDQEDATNWLPSPTNQAGSLLLSHGSEISTAIQTRQEILVFTDMAVYALQNVGAPVVWGATLLADSVSCVSPNGAVAISDMVFWMGNDKFYMYDGTVKTLSCDLRRYVFTDINRSQPYQIFAGTNEQFNEVWWFYCSENSIVVDRYVVYNYLEKIWYYGTMSRTAWLDSDVRDYPIAATYSNNLVYHEQGLNDNVDGVPSPINAYIESAEWDADDGHNFSFMYRMLPDITFENSTNTPDGDSPQVTLSIIPLKNSGSGYTTPASVGGSNTANVNRIATVPIEQFTGQVFVRVRGRQFIFKIESNQLNTAWQLGSPRVDIRKDGRR